MKENIEIIHVSDTHILKNVKNTMLEGIYPEDSNPVDVFRTIIKDILKKHTNADILVISGDIIHEGTEEDYIELQLILNELVKIPVILSLGNHDRFNGFEKVFLKDNYKNSYYYSKDYFGYRFIILDSRIEGKEDGEINNEQLNWLKGILKEKSEKGSILVFHHPVINSAFGSMEEHCLKNSRELLDVIKNTDVKAILSGHTHQGSYTLEKDIMSIVAGSTAFGVSMDEENMYINNDTSYNTVNISEGDITILVHNLGSKKIYSKISIKELMETFKGNQKKEGKN